MDIQDRLRKVEPLVLLRKIGNFRKLNISQMSSEEINHAILDVHCWDGFLI